MVTRKDREEKESLVISREVNAVSTRMRIVHAVALTMMKKDRAVVSMTTRKNPVVVFAVTKTVPVAALRMTTVHVVALTMMKKDRVVVSMMTRKSLVVVFVIKKIVPAAALRIRTVPAAALTMTRKKPRVVAVKAMSGKRIPCMTVRQPRAKSA